MNNISKKKCTKCKEEKNISEFSLQRKNVYRSRCNSCKNEDNRIYRMNNKEKDKKSKENWLKNNPNYYKSYYEENKENLKNYLSEYYQENKDIILKKSNDYYKENVDSILISRKNHYDNNKELYRIRGLKNFYRQRTKFPHRFAWRLLLKNTIQRMNTSKADLTINILGYSANDLKTHMESLFQEGMSWNNWGEWHIHHIKFVSQFHIDTPQHIVNALDNLIPLWKEDHKKIHKNYA